MIMVKMILIAISLVVSMMSHDETFPQAKYSMLVLGGDRNYDIGSNNNNFVVRAVGSACMCSEGGIARAVCCGEAGGPIHDFVLVQK